MPSAITSTLLLSSKPRFLFNDTFCFSSSTCGRSLQHGNVSPKLKPFILKCSSNSEEQETGNSLKDSLSVMVDKQVDELLNREENKGLLDGLEKASQRVEMAKRQLAEIGKQELEAQLVRNYIEQLESRASEIAESQQEILQARAMIEEAERSLSPHEDDFGDGNIASTQDGKGIDKDKDRLESAKAALISAVVGAIAGLPISLTQVSSPTQLLLPLSVNFISCALFGVTQVSSPTQLLLPLSVNFISCALFGVTFRYAVRRDLDDFHLKSGTAAAFGFAKGLGTLVGGAPLELDTESLLLHAVDGGVYVSQNLIVFLFAVVGLDFAIKMRILSPFPTKRSGP